MTEKILSTNNLISCVKSSYMLDFISSAQVWFTHINLSLVPDSMIPDNGCIADQLITFYDLEEFQYCLILFERKRTEQWTEKKGFVPFQSLIFSVFNIHSGFFLALSATNHSFAEGI